MIFCGSYATISKKWGDFTDGITEAGIKKKSFELYYNGGSIWCEHLDGMGLCKEKVIEKFLDDYEKAKQWVLP